MEHAIEELINAGYEVRFTDPNPEGEDYQATVYYRGQFLRCGVNRSTTGALLEAVTSLYTDRKYE